MAMCACITETRPLCRAIMWPASGCVCEPRPITGSTPMRFQVLAPMDGQPFLYVNKEVDPGLIATLKQDVIPWLEANVAKTPEQQRRLAEDPRAHWFTIVFDREGYSPELFRYLWQKRIAMLTYHKFPKQDCAVKSSSRTVSRWPGAKR